MPDVFENIRQANREVIHAEVHFGMRGQFDDKGREVIILAAWAEVKSVEGEQDNTRWGFKMAYLPKDLPEQILCKFGDVEQIVKWGDRFVYDAPEEAKENSNA